MSPAVIIEEQQLRIPADLDTLERFRNWARSEDFPPRGRIDFLAGDIEVDMSPEDLHAHGTVKAAIAATLHQLIAGGDRGEVFIDRTRVSSGAASLSVEPDVVAVLWGSLEVGRCRYVPATDREPGRFLEIEGGPDLVVEIVSRSSRGKDTERLPPLYARAGVPELWLVDALGDDLAFQLYLLDTTGYRPAEVDRGGWVASPCLGLAVRLTRERTRLDTWRYQLETRS